METTQPARLRRKTLVVPGARQTPCDAGPLRHGNRRGRAVPANQRGVGGMIPLIIMAILAFPMTFLLTAA